MDSKQPDSSQDTPNTRSAIMAGPGAGMSFFMGGQAVSGGDGGVTLRAMVAQMAAYQALRNEPPTVPKPRSAPDPDRPAVNRHERRAQAAQFRHGR